MLDLRLGADHLTGQQWECSKSENVDEEEAVLDGGADLNAKWAGWASKTEKLRGICPTTRFARVLLKDCLSNADGLGY